MKRREALPSSTGMVLLLQARNIDGWKELERTGCGRLRRFEVRRVLWRGLSKGADVHAPERGRPHWRRLSELAIVLDMH